MAIFIKSFTITKAIILKISFSIPFSPKAFSFRRLLISLLISFFEIIGLILNTFYSIIAFILILLKSIILVLEKNFTTKMSIFIVLLFIKGSLIDLLRFNN